MTDYKNAWAAYLRHMMADRTQADLAKAIAVTDGQLSKWLSQSSGVTPETVMEIARRLGDNPVHALGRVGWLSVRDLVPFRVPRQYGLDEYTDLELASEIVRRIEAGENAYWIADHDRADELAARRAEREDVPGSVEDGRQVAKKKSRDRGGDDGQG